jgi:hypothetical protein
VNKAGALRALNRLDPVPSLEVGIVSCVGAVQRDRRHRAVNVVQKRLEAHRHEEFATAGMFPLELFTAVSPLS